jgi:hypothetical protein
MLTTGKKNTLEDNREFSRVDAFVPMEVRLLPEGEHKRVRSRVTRRAMPIVFSNPGGVEDKALEEWLKTLNAKLDFIIDALDPHKDGFSNLPFCEINISAGGMSFMTHTHYKKGDVLEIKMAPSNVQDPVALCIYGEVVRIEKREREYRTAVKFILLEEDVRDELVRYVFERQREVLRERKR